MKIIFTAIVIGIALAGVSLAQTSAKGLATKTSLAVVEFTPGPNASAMTVEAKRQLQASIAFSLTKTNKYHIVDVRNTRDASQADLASINGASTSAAVRLGKQMGVSHVLTGNVVEYNTKGTATMNFRLVDVATGKVRYSGAITQQATSPMNSDGATEMMLKVLRPSIARMTTELTSL